MSLSIGKGTVRSCIGMVTVAVSKQGEGLILDYFKFSFYVSAF